MGIPLPDLDDLTFDGLTAQARSLIPALYPAWTDHNPSDPGITLVELLASLTEMLAFQLNQVPEAHVRTFLALLNGPDWSPPAGTDLAESVRQTLGRLDERYRAATAGDYEHLVARVWPGTAEATALGAVAGVRRVRCVPDRNLTGGSPDEPAPGHVSVVVLPDDGPHPAEALTTGLWTFLDPRRILTTRHHVVGPTYVDVGIAANLALHEDSPPAETLTAAWELLAAFLDPFTGGTDGTGWPFGRAVHVSEIYAALERLPLVDYVEDVLLTGPRPLLDTAGATTGIALADHELVRFARLDLVGYDVLGEQHPFGWAAP